MKLSDAIVLGSTTCKLEARNWNACAVGVAANAVGIVRSFSTTICGIRIQSDREGQINRRWPWLGSCLATYADIRYHWSFLQEIVFRFDRRVCESGEANPKKFEELVAFIRSVEPSCGDCNQFTCTCAKPVEQPAEINDYASSPVAVEV